MGRGICIFVGSAFQLGFLPPNPHYKLELFAPMEQKLVCTSDRRWAVESELNVMFFFFFFSLGDRNIAKNALQSASSRTIKNKKTKNGARGLRRQDIRGWSLMIIQFSTPYAAAAASASAGGGRGCSGSSSSGSLFWLAIKSVASVSWSTSTIIRAFSIFTICVAMAIVKVLIAFVDI